MSMSFNPLDVLRLQVQNDWPELPNLVANPSGEDGAWGWSVDAGSTLTGGPAGLRLEPDLSDDLGAASYAVPLDRVTAPGLKVKAWFTITDFDGSTQAMLQMTATLTPAGFSNLGDTGWKLAPGTYSIEADVPVSTRSIGIAIITTPTDGVADAGDAVTFLDVVAVVGTAAEVAATDLLGDPGWTDVLGSALQVEAERTELNLGTLRAQIVGADLDPASNALIRKGKPVRLQTLVDGAWEHVFRGKLDNAKVSYDLRDPSLPDEKRTRIALTATDHTTDLATASRPEGVATIDELPYVLLGTGVPWNVNGSTAAIEPASVTVVSRNEQASAIDQIAVTRDTVLGYAWLDRGGVLQAWDAAEIPTTVAEVIDEADYSDLGVEFDTERCINEVTIKLLRINPGTGETEEVRFGPYADEASIRQWGRRAAEFTVQGVDEASLPDYAAAILAANANPVRRINSVRLPLRTVAEVEAHALRDLYDLLTVSNDRADLADDLRVTTMKHTITAGATLEKCSWDVDLGFSSPSSVAPPQVVPSPVPLGGKTVAELLRPVREVTMWYGAKADCPAGWLVLDGSTFDEDVYPELFTYLGTNVLPDYTDRVPVGAGTKALGSTGGASTVVLTGVNLPPHTHSMAHKHTLDFAAAEGASPSMVPRGNNTLQTTGSGPVSEPTNANTGNGPGASTPVNIQNPYRALWFIIRAA